MPSARVIRQPSKPVIGKFSSVDPIDPPFSEYGEVELNDNIYSLGIDLGFTDKISVIRSLVVNSDASMRTFLIVSKSEFRDVKFSGTVFEGSLKDVRFIRCKFSRVVFEQGITLSRVEFVECEISDVSFYKTKIIDMAMKDSDFSGIGFDSALLSRVSLITSRLSISDPSTLKSCIINNEQLIKMIPEISRTLGLIVQD